MRGKKKTDCCVEKGKRYNLEIVADVRGGMSKRNIDLRTKFKGDCIYKNDNIAVFDNGLYRVSHLVNCYGIDWKAVEV